MFNLIYFLLKIWNTQAPLPSLLFSPQLTLEDATNSTQQMLLKVPLSSEMIRLKFSPNRMDMVTPLTIWSLTKTVCSALILSPILPTKVHNSDSGTVELVPTSTLIQPSGNMMQQMVSSTSVSSMTKIPRSMKFGSTRLIFGTTVKKDFGDANAYWYTHTYSAGEYV